MNFKRINNIAGWVIFFCALVIYTLTMEKTASFWDSGEFIAAANKLQVVHPPGAPLYLLLGRLFSMFLPPEQVAFGVNFLSVISTAFAALFLFWSTTILAKRLVSKTNESLTKGEIVAIIGSGIVAAFSFIFQDSQWFNAVETEVYALSTALTAAVFWMALKWSTNQDKPFVDKYLIAICYVIGLSIGVHLLNLLVIPAIALLIYFYRSKTISLKGGLLAFVAGLAALLFIQYGVILQIPQLGSGFELLFVNEFGLPFNSGMIFFLVIVAIIPILLLTWLHTNNKNLFWVAVACIGLIAISSFFKSSSNSGQIFRFLVIAGLGAAIYYFRERKSFIYKASLGFLFIIIGYLSYLFVPIRSAANTPIDINNPDNIFSLLSYLSREQYGDRPLLYGPTYNAEVIGTKDIGNVYQQKDGKYVIVDQKIDYEFAPDDMAFFPRAWQFNGQDKQETYKIWLNKLPNDESKPSLIDHIKFLYSYQLDFMYWRYFMWNFAGRQNSVQANGNREFGNWESGISFVDKTRTIQADVKPDTIANNPSVNHFYLLPFILGIIGIVLQFYFDRKDGFILSALFLLTGVAIVIYLNQEPNQPRERDYSYVGSFMAYAIWIGLAVAGLYRVSRELISKQFQEIAIGTVAVFASLFFLGLGANNIATLFPIFVVLIVGVAIFYFLAISLKSQSGSVKAIILTAIVAIAPAIMGFVGWDDHDRNELHLAVATGKNYLTPTKENAILFTEGDNDTYPLWHAQEILGVRPDIRIINNSLLKADWYINQIQQHNGFQQGVEISFAPEKYEAGNREVIYYAGEDLYPYLSLQNLIQFIETDDERTKYKTQRGEIDILPTKMFTLDIDHQAQVENNLVSPQEVETIDSTLVIALKKDNLVRDEYIIYDIIQRNINKRPIYFTSENLPRILGLSPYIKREGGAFRLYPKIDPTFGDEDWSPLNPYVNKEKTLAFMQNEMEWGNVKSGVYLDETGQRQIMRIFDYSSKMVNDFAAEGNNEAAWDTYSIIKEHIYNSQTPKDDLYYLYRNTSIVESLFKIGQPDEASELAKSIIDSSIRQLLFIESADYPVSNLEQKIETLPMIVENIRQLALDYEQEELGNWIDVTMSKLKGENER